MPTVLITGCDRGLGEEFAVQYLNAGWKVFATCMKPEYPERLKGAAGDLTLHPLDVTSAAQMKAVAASVAEEPIDLLLSNAALGMSALGGHNPGVGAVDYGVWLRMLEVNTLAPMQLVETFLANVAKSERKMIAFVSSRMGSIGFNKTGKGYAYRSSKAALNSVAKSLSVDLLPLRVAVITLHPGNAKTYPGPGSRVEVKDSVSGMRAILERSTVEDTGTFYMYDGTVLPW